MPTKIIPIRGMHCASCEIVIADELKKIPGVESAQANQRRGEAIIRYGGAEPSSAAVERAVQEAGYEVGQKAKLPWISRRPGDYRDLAWAAMSLLVIYWLAKSLGASGLSISDPSGTGPFVALAVGLVAGVSTCMALVGGLVLGLSARHAEMHPEATGMQRFRPHIYFNLGRIGGYAALGGLIGLIGSAFRPSPNVLGVMTVAVGGVMVFLGLKLVEVFPALRDKTLTLPSGLARMLGLSRETKEYSARGSFAAGALTFFLPCGFTQAMQVYAVSTGSFWQGAAIMSLFALGTAPGLLGIGTLSSFLKGRRARLFFMAAGLAVIVLGLGNIVNGSRLIGGRAANAAAPPSGETQEVRMTQGASGYSPNVLTVKKGVPVKWIIDSTSRFSCAASIVLPKYGISRSLSSGENVIYFTPTEAGEVPFSCSMGMYRGKFIVTDGSAAEGKPPIWAAAISDGSAAAPAASGSCGAGGCGCGGGRPPQPAAPAGDPKTEGGVQALSAAYTAADYLKPNDFTVKAGQKVRLTIVVKDDGQGCGYAIAIPGLYDAPETLSAGRTIVMEFTPTTPGRYDITCAMRMIRFGSITVK